MQTFIITLKVEPDTDAERKLLINAFDHERESSEILLHDYISDYVDHAFPGMKVTRADHERYPTLLKVYLESTPHN